MAEIPVNILQPTPNSTFCSMSGSLLIQWDDLSTALGSTGKINVYAVDKTGTRIPISDVLDSDAASTTWEYNDNHGDFTIEVEGTNGDDVARGTVPIHIIGKADIAWETPKSGSILTCATLLRVTATDDKDVDRVEFSYMLDGTDDWVSIGYVTEAPWELVWDTTKVPDGSYRLRARAYSLCSFEDDVVELDGRVTVNNLPENYVQYLIDGELCIPQYKPEAEEIVEFKVTPKITSIKVFTAFAGKTKLLLLGEALIEIQYVAATPTQSMHTAHFFTKPIKTFIEIDNLSTCARLEPIIVCEHLSYHLCGPRTIKKEIVLFIGVKEVL